MGWGGDLKAQRDAGKQTSELTLGERSGKRRNRDLSTTLSSFPENTVCFLDNSAGRPKNRGVFSLMVQWNRMLILSHKRVGVAAVPVRHQLPSEAFRCSTASHMIQLLYFIVRRASMRLVDVSGEGGGRHGGPELENVNSNAFAFPRSSQEVEGGTNHRGGRWMSKQEEWRERETDGDKIKGTRTEGEK